MSDQTTTNPKGLVFTVVAVASMMSIIGSLGAPLLSTIAQANHVSLSTAEWMLTSTLLTGALATPIMGRLADGRHQRRVVLVALSICIAGLVIAGLSKNFTELLVGRSLQGLGMGLMPVTMAIARAHLDAQTSARTVATLSVTAAVGVGLGYPITSLIAEHFDYHAAFWFAGVLVGCSWVLAYVRLPRFNPPKERTFDLWGSVLLTVSLIGIMAVLGEGQVWGWTSLKSLAIGLAGVIVLALWVRFETRQLDPLVNFKQSAHRAVITADISAFLIAVSMYLYIPIVVEYVQLPKSSGFGFGSSILTSGLLLLPLSVTTFLSSRFVPAIAARLNARVIIPIGCIIFAVGSGLFTIWNHALWQAFMSVAIAGVGAGFTFAAMPGYVVRSVPSTETGGALGFYQLLRSIGLSVGSAVAGGILAFFTKHGASIPTLNGFRTVLFAATGLLLLSMMSSYFLLGDNDTKGPVTPEVVAIMEENAELGTTGFGLDPE